MNPHAPEIQSTPIQSAAIQSTLGCDVSKDTVTLFDSATGKTITAANTAAALNAVLAPHAGSAALLAICEVTGGYEDELLRVLAHLAIPAHRADAARVKAFIRSCGTRAKTDPIDARHIAAYGLSRAASLPRWQPVPPEDASVKLLVMRRADLVAMRVQEENRRKAPRNKPIAAMAASHSSSPLAETYKRLVGAGKSKLTALGALMRHIIVIANARLREYEAQEMRLT